MLNIKQEIEKFFTLGCRNTNNKEQNFQGRLYAYLLPLEQCDYVVEMETNVKQDEHLEGWLSDEDRGSLAKSEIDILIYKTDFSEKYAIELKWIYHRDNGWNVTDNLSKFQQDLKFCQQLTDAGFNECCTVVVYDFDPAKQIKNPKSIVNNCEKQAFNGKLKDGVPQNGEILGCSIEWKHLKHINLELDQLKDADYWYYIISTKDKGYS